MKYGLEKRLKAVETYLQGGTLKKVARQFNIHSVTLCRWVKWYKNFYKKGKRQYKKPWNRPSKTIEEKIVSLKEHQPSITLTQAQHKLKKGNIRISRKGIYEIWRRYNFTKRSVDNPFSPFGPITPETERVIAQVSLLLKDNQEKHKKVPSSILKKAAGLLNDLPCFPAPHEKLLEEIPEKYLSPHRQLEKIDAEFMHLPKPLLYKKVKRLRLVFEKRRLYYSSINAGILEILAMHWMRSPEQELVLNQRLRKRMKDLREPVLNFVLSFLAGTAHTSLLQMKKARNYARRCKKLLGSLPHAQMYILYGDLMTFISNYKEALVYYNKVLNMKVSETLQKTLILKTALAAVIAGEYKRTRHLLRKIKCHPDDPQYETYVLIRALFSIGKGRLEKARQYLLECLEKSEQQKFRNYIYTASSCLAAINHALGRTREAQQILKKYLPLLKKYRVEREATMIQALLRKKLIDEKSESFPILKVVSLLQTAAKTLKTQDYHHAYHAAEKTGLLGLYHRITLFFPEPVRTLLQKGKNTHLPKSILNLPIYNKSAPVYHVKFMGNMIVYKNGKYLKTKLTPKEKALFITFSQRINEPGRSMHLPDIYKNFWSRSKNPASRLSHTLVQLKQKIMMPQHLVAIRTFNGTKRVVNKGFYITTDFDELKTNFAEAHAMERIGEWNFARKKFYNAFNLLHGEPLRKMYDHWSEHTRRVIFNKLESELTYFEKLCDKYQNVKDAKKVRQRLTQIIPFL